MRSLLSPLFPLLTISFVSFSGLPDLCFGQTSSDNRTGTDPLSSFYYEHIGDIEVKEFAMTYDANSKIYKSNLTLTAHIITDKSFNNNSGNNPDVFDIKINSVIPTKKFKNSTSKPTLILFPPYDGEKLTNILYNRIIAKYFSKRGFNVYYHHMDTNLCDPSHKIEEIDKILIRNTIASSILIDYLSKKKYVDVNQIFVMGASFGSIRTNLVYGTDVRVKKAISIAGAGNLPLVLSTSTLKHIVNFRKYQMEMLINEEGYKKDDFSDNLFSLFNERINIDPLNLVSTRSPENLWLILSTEDNYVNHKAQEELLLAFIENNNQKPVYSFIGKGHIKTAIRSLKFLKPIKNFFLDQNRPKRFQTVIPEPQNI